MSIAQSLGKRIRTLREAAGMTQSDLAKAAYVTRQSVGNWECGNTLPDVQSLQLVAAALGTTVDGLVGDDLPTIAEDAAKARRELMRCMAGLALAFALYLLVTFVDVSLLRGDWNFEAKMVCNAIRLTISFASMPLMRRFRKVVCERDLGDAVNIMMFVEGYPNGKEPPSNFFYRVLLTNLPAFYTLYAVLLTIALAAVAFA